MGPHATKKPQRCLDCGEVPSPDKESACPGCRVLTAYRGRSIPKDAVPTQGTPCHECRVEQVEAGQIRLVSCPRHMRAVFVGRTTARCGEPTANGPCSKYAEKGGPCRHHRSSLAAPERPAVAASNRPPPRVADAASGNDGLIPVQAEEVHNEV